ncbi:YeeE/YedE thiosulfate transporter family protein [Ancylobacter vacuolatus]|uniref:Membrane protein YedE/YeeE n=1 Tax=Ancylobacter vacuolatus TaxID=223389 RepID=A0ABU0DPP0_9HYPH|nr:putative membrane protein YedE/YeeE [Ancylobacter vacuolatus]
MAERRGGAGAGEIEEAPAAPDGEFVDNELGLCGGQFAPRRPSWRDVSAGLAGGVLMGWRGMTALGCTVGVLLSGIHAGALSGWVFLVAAFAGLLIGLPLRRRIAG